MVLNEYVNSFLLSLANKLLVVFQKLDGGFSDEDVDTSLNSVKSNGEMGWIWGKDCDGIARLEAVNGRFIGVGIFLVVGRE